MPGTIQISVLEFKGLPVELSPSSLKVSLGKREYQTSDMNEFSFPLTTLRDDLIVAVYDAEGNELAHLGIRTMSIVEKVYWDDMFPLEGGGYLHLKLKFMLSQQEQTRIRAMREAALKEKQVSGASALSARVTNLVGAASHSSSHSERTLSDPQTSSALEVKNLEDSVQAGLLSKHDIQEPGFANEERILPIKEIPKDNVNREKAGFDPSGREAEARPEKKIDTRSSIHGTPQKSGFSDKASSKKESPISTIASNSDSLNLKSVSKVKKIASAFETGLAKDVEYTLSPAVVKVVGKKFLKGGNPKEFEPTNSVEEHDRSSRLVAVGSKLNTVRGVNNAISAESNVDDVECQATVRSKQSTSFSIDPWTDTKHTDEKGMATENSDTLSTCETVTSSGIVTDPMGMNMNTEETGISTAYSDSDRSLPSETTSTLGKKLEYDFNSEFVHLYDLSAKKYCSKDDLNPEEKRRKDPYATKFNPSNDKSIPLEYIEEVNVLIDKSGMCTFFRDRMYFCVMTAGKKVKDLIGSLHAEVKPYHDEVMNNIHGDSFEHETDEKNEKDSEESVDTKESKPESPSNDAWNGLVAQAVKIALVVGFGVLVFLTRNKHPRKTTKTERGLSLFKHSEYMNDPVLEAENWIDS